MLRRLLAVLLCNSGTSVPISVLMEALWAGQPSPSGRKTLHVYVRWLRRALDAYERIVHREGGYAAIVEPGELDSRSFVDLAGRGRAAMQCADLPSARALLDEALRLWRGPAFAGLETSRSSRTRRAGWPSYGPSQPRISSRSI
jgi:DNA-binding SARP family transcriptional activator